MSRSPHVAHIIDIDIVRSECGPMLLLLVLVLQTCGVLLVPPSFMSGDLGDVKRTTLLVLHPDFTSSGEE